MVMVKGQFINLLGAELYYEIVGESTRISVNSIT